MLYEEKSPTQSPRPPAPKGQGISADEVREYFRKKYTLGSSKMKKPKQPRFSSIGLTPSKVQRGKEKYQRELKQWNQSEYIRKQELFDIWAVVLFRLKKWLPLTTAALILVVWQAWAQTQ